MVKLQIRYVANNLFVYFRFIIRLLYKTSFVAWAELGKGVTKAFYLALDSTLRWNKVWLKGTQIQKKIKINKSETKNSYVVFYFPFYTVFIIQQLWSEVFKILFMKFPNEYIHHTTFILFNFLVQLKRL